MNFLQETYRLPFTVPIFSFLNTIFYLINAIQKKTLGMPMSYWKQINSEALLSPVKHIP